MARRLWLAAALLLALAGPVQAGEGRGPLLKVTPLRDGRYLLEPLSGLGRETRPHGNPQPNLNLPADRRVGGQTPHEQHQSGQAVAGSPAGQPGM